MGSRLSALGDKDVSGDEDCQATAARKMVIGLLPGRGPDTVPSQRITCLSLTVLLLLAKLVFLYEARIRLWATKPCYGISRATHIGRYYAEFPVGQLTSSATGGRSRTWVCLAGALYECVARG